MPGIPDSERIMPVDESEDLAVIDSDAGTPNYPDTQYHTLSTNCDKFSLADRREAETALTDLKQVLKPR
jgi:hypothetical protein